MYRKQHQDTAQLMIVTAFVLALTFLLLATLLNLAIYAENKSARGLTVADQTAYESQVQIDDTITTFMRHTNQATNTTNPSAVRTNIKEGMSSLHTIETISEAKQTELATMQLLDTNTGTRLVQDTERNFTAASNASDWTVLDDSDGTRNMTQTVQRDSLYKHSNSSESINSIILSTMPAFETKFSNTTEDWTVYMFGADYSNKINLYVTDDSGSVYGSCSVTQSVATINYSTRTLGGTDCAALDFLTTLDTPHSIQYRNSHNVEGTYQIHTTNSISKFTSGNYHTPSDNSVPYKSASMYSVTYKYAFTDSRIDYDVIRTVAPCNITA